MLSVHTNNNNTSRYYLFNASETKSKQATAQAREVAADRSAARIPDGHADRGLGPVADLRQDCQAPRGHAIFCTVLVRGSLVRSTSDE